jgi:hypothetical protein
MLQSAKSEDTMIPDITPISFATSAIDRTTECPFLSPVFVNNGSFHTVDHFLDNPKPIAIHSWFDYLNIGKTQPFAKSQICIHH